MENSIKQKISAAILSLTMGLAPGAFAQESDADILAAEVMSGGMTLQSVLDAMEVPNVCGFHAFYDKHPDQIESAVQGWCDALRLMGTPPPDIDCKDAGGRTVLFRAVADNNEAAARALFGDSVCALGDPKTTNNNGSNPFLRAAVNGNIAMMELALSHGNDINSTRNDGANALDIAARKGNADTIDFVLGKRINIPFAPETVNLFHGRGRGNDNYEAIAHVLITRSLDGQFRSRSSMLHYAVHENDEDLLIALLKDKADCSATNNRGLNPAAKAQKMGRLQLVAKMESQGGSRCAPPVCVVDDNIRDKGCVCKFPMRDVDGVCKPRIQACANGETVSVANCNCDLGRQVQDGKCKPDCSQGDSIAGASCVCKSPLVDVGGNCATKPDCAVGQSPTQHNCFCRPPMVDNNDWCENPPLPRIIPRIILRPTCSDPGFPYQCGFICRSEPCGQTGR